MKLDVNGKREENRSRDLGHGKRVEGKDEESGGKGTAGIERVVVGLLLPADGEKGGGIDPDRLTEGEADMAICNACHFVCFIVV